MKAARLPSRQPYGNANFSLSRIPRTIDGQPKGVGSQWQLQRAPSGSLPAPFPELKSQRVSPHGYCVKSEFFSDSDASSDAGSGDLDGAADFRSLQPVKVSSKTVQKVNRIVQICGLKNRLIVSPIKNGEV